MKEIVRINDKDNVAVALMPISAGSVLEAAPGVTVTALEDIPQGHKIALEDIREGEGVVKYGFPIGHATADAKAGSWMLTFRFARSISAIFRLK